MAIIASAWARVEPSFVEPEILLQYNQASAFVDVLADRQLRTRLGEDDLFVYMKQLNLRTRVASGQAAANQLPGIEVIASQISTATYMFRIRSQYDHHDVRAGSNWGFSVVDAYRLGMRQGHYQFARDACLFGMNPQFGEGLLNSAGAYSTNLPPDMNGHDTVLSYDNGEMAFYLSAQIQQIKTRTMQMGIGKQFTILGPQRTLGSFEYNVVQLTQFQRDGAGTASTAGTVKSILMGNGDELIWGYDDALQGAGGSSNLDVVIISMPEVTKPKGKAQNTNEFANLSPGNAVCSTQYCDMPAPREILSPLAGGATDFLTEWRVSSGWAVRGQGLSLITMSYA